MTLQFYKYKVKDQDVITLYFVSMDPGPGEPSDYSVDVLDSEISLLQSKKDFDAFVMAKLQRKILAAPMAAQLDSYLDIVQDPNSVPPDTLAQFESFTPATITVSAGVTI